MRARSPQRIRMPMKLRADGGPTAVGPQQWPRHQPAATTTAARADARRWQRHALEPRDAAVTDVAANDDVTAHDVHASTTTTSAAASAPQPEGAARSPPHRNDHQSRNILESSRSQLGRTRRRRHSGARADCVRRLRKSQGSRASSGGGVDAARVHAHARPSMLPSACCMLAHCALGRLPAPRLACRSLRLPDSVGTHG